MIPPLIGANVILLLKTLITFSCTNLFQVSRIELINSITLIVSPYNLIDEIINQDLFLYGHRNISSEDNMKIILSTTDLLKIFSDPAPLPFSHHRLLLLLLLPLHFSVLFVSCLYCTYSCMCCACRC